MNNNASNMGTPQFVVEEIDTQPKEIRLKFPDLLNSNGGLSVIKEPTHAGGYKQGDSHPYAGKKTRVVPVGQQV